MHPWSIVATKWIVSGQICNVNLQRYRAYWPLIIHKVMCPCLPCIGWRPLGRRWWKFFLWWPSNRYQRVEDQLLSQTSHYLVSSCQVWYMGPIVSISGSWWTWSCSWRYGEHPMLYFHGFAIMCYYLWPLFIIEIMHHKCKVKPQVEGVFPK
jgi:hypothetical protein